MKPCVVIPTYDNPETLADVVRGALEHCPDVIVVDDGSREPVALEGVTLIRHETNLGKGAALRDGFEKAAELGFTHAVTIDADGQHPAGEIPKLLEASGDALVLGARDLKASGAAFLRRLAVRNSNLWTWVETGLRLPDTQSGLRSYPLAAIRPLRLTTTGYDFEIEVLVKAAWAGVPVRSVGIEARYNGHVSHYRPVVDFLRIARLNVRLVFMRICLPAPYLSILVRTGFYQLSWADRIRESLVELFLREPGPAERVALSVALGLFMGLAPIWGFQIAATLLVAHATGLSKPVAVVASHISVPIFIPAILYLSLLLGRLALGTYEGAITSLDLEPADFPAWVVGSLILAGVTAVVGGLLTYVVLKCLRREKEKRA